MSSASAPSERMQRRDTQLPVPAGDGPSATASERYRSILLVVCADGATSDAPRVASYLAARDAAALRVLSLDSAQCDALPSPDAVAEHVCRAAVHHAADLIVLDALHDIADVAPASATRMAIIRLASAPVLALGAGAPHAARTLVLATDFSRASIKAAREALRAAAPTHVHLVHVAAARRTQPFGGSTNGADNATTSMLFGAMVPTLAIAPDVTVHCVTLTGDPAAALLECSERVHADLIGVGRHGRHGGPGTELGPIAAEITRRSTCSVFVPAGGERADRLTVA